MILLTCSLSSAVTKLQVSKSKRTLTLVENRPIQLNCSVKSQTSQNSHFAVLWYVHKPSDADGKLILKTTHNSAFEYGTYAEEEGLRARLQFERHVSGGLFSLTVQRAEVSDSGSYYCHVEEWLLSPNYAWYKLAEEVSGRTEVTVKQPGKHGAHHPRPVGLVGSDGLHRALWVHAGWGCRRTDHHPWALGPPTPPARGPGAEGRLSTLDSAVADSVFTREGPDGQLWLAGCGKEGFWWLLALFLGLQFAPWTLGWASAKPRIPA